ncbi:hypothetical protein [Lentibacillus sp. CBA3610]|uniref:hypothetical protein n=1 Tax=Lentibacillus sp. CBA3610 TaxID=2518176 RepID=UPI001595D9B7|nr:hypothetical protein [Lentibacillus sp. CBA3610]
MTKEDKKMTSATKPVKSTEINFDSEKEFKDFTEFVNNPPEPSKFVKELIEQYQEQKRGK